MCFVLDTHAVVAVLNEPTGSVSRRMRRHAPADIGVSAIMIAGQARARGLALVAHNLREFTRVAGLAIVDWTV